MRLSEMLAEIEVDAVLLFVRVGGGVVDAVRVNETENERDADAESLKDVEGEPVRVSECEEVRDKVVVRT